MNNAQAALVRLHYGVFKAVAIALSSGLRAAYTDRLRLVALDSADSRRALARESHCKHAKERSASSLAGLTASFGFRAALSFLYNSSDGHDSQT